MDAVCTEAWKKKKEANNMKIDWLVAKWRRNSHREEPEIRGVKYRDEDLQIPVKDKNPEVWRCRGD